MFARLDELAQRRFGGESDCLWPSPYNQDSPEAGFRFLTECWWTLNEADQSVALVPPKEYIRQFVSLWHEARTARQPLVVEKSRRLLMSWVCRGLETWQLGLRRGELVLVDQTQKNAAEHLWRVHFSLSELASRRPELRVPRHEARGALTAKECSLIRLANGSLLTMTHQNAGAEQGKGKTDVILEELSRYRNPAGYWGQALIVTQGAASGPGGWVCAICNSSPNPDWQSVKEGVSARKLLGLE